MSVGEAEFGAAARGAARSGAVSRFYLGMAALLLALVLLGFGRTLYLRPLFEVPPIGFWVWVHGLALTAWFVGLFLQTLLVAARRTDIHRRAGWVLAAVAVVVVATSTWITRGTVAAMFAAGFDANTVTALAPRVAWGNYASALTFGLLVGAAVGLRRHPRSHKRLMLLASIAIITPALARMLQLPVFGAGINANFLAVAAVVAYALVGVVAVYDLVLQRRVHRATLVGAALVIGVKLASGIVIAPSAFGRALVLGPQ
jgi:hypothetical protein